MIDEFPERVFNVRRKNGNIKDYPYRPWLHFVHDNITPMWDLTIKVAFHCIFCNVKISVRINESYNVKLHLDKHIGEISQTDGNQKLFDDFTAWNKSYNSFQTNTSHNKYLIDEETLRIVLYFVARNAALSDFDSFAFRNLLIDYKKKIPCSKTFKTTVLNEIMGQVENKIEEMLKNSASIVIISDIWTSKSMLDFMGIAVNIIYPNFEKETRVIGLELMPGAHNAENIKIAIERIVNKYDFDKSRIYGN